MNAPPAAAERPGTLVEIIDLKWLLACEGMHLHVERLQADPAYATQVLALADASPHEAVRHAAERVRRTLDLPR